jgi:arylsulfatase
MWLFVPIQAKLQEFFATLPQFPFQEGNSLTAGNINYNSLKAMKALEMLKEIEDRFPVPR